MASPPGAQLNQCQAESLYSKLAIAKRVSSVSLFLSLDLMCFAVHAAKHAQHQESKISEEGKTGLREQFQHFKPRLIGPCQKEGVRLKLAEICQKEGVGLPMRMRRV